MPAGSTLPTSVSTVSMTSGSLAGQIWQNGTDQPAVQRADGLLLRVDFTGPRLAISSFAFSPVDENCLIVGDICGGVFVFHLQKNQFSLVARYAGPVTSVSWIDCASHVACVCGGAAYIVDISTARSTSKALQGPHKRPITRIAVPAVSPRGTLALVSGDALSVWRGQDQACLKMISSASSFLDAAMSDEALYVIEGHHTLRCWTVAGFTHLETMTMREFSFVRLECSSRQLFAATDNGTVVIFHDLSLGSALCAVHLLTTSLITSIVVNRPADGDSETIFGCVQNDGVVSFVSLPPPKEMTDTTAANLVLSFRAMPSALGGSINSNFRIVSCFGNKELKLFHLPTSKQAYDRLSGEKGGAGRPPPLNTFVSFVQRRGVDGTGTRPSWVSTASTNNNNNENNNSDISRKNPHTAASNHDNNNNNNNNNESRNAGQRLASPNKQNNEDTIPLTPSPLEKRKPSTTSTNNNNRSIPTKENALRDRMPAPTGDTLKNWLRVNLLNSAEATPMNVPVVAGDFSHTVASQRSAQVASVARTAAPSSSASKTAEAAESTSQHNIFPQSKQKFEDTSTVEGILGLRPMLNASSRQQNLDKLRCLLMRYGAFPEQYRALIWRFLLCLPEKAKMQPYYALLCSKGSHLATPSLLKPFPLADTKLKFALTKAVNCLCHHAPPFTAAHFVPATVFPFLHVYHADVQSVVEVVLSFYLNWGKEFFLYYPHMPVSIAAFVSQTLQQEDRELYDHFLSVGLGPEHFAWEPLMALYTEVLSTNEWLQTMDHALANAPIWLFLFHVRWLVQMRALLLRVADIGAMLTYFHKATPFDINVAIQQTYRLQSRYMKNDITLLYERLETFPIDQETNSIIYPAEFDCHESVVFSKQEQLKEIEDHEQQMKVASRRAAIAERHAKEASMLEEAFVRRQRALVESKFDAANAAWEQKILLERERQRLRDVEHEARLHAVQEQLRSAGRIEMLQQELGAASETEQHATTDRAMESEKWKITEKMAALEIDRMEKAAKMKLATMIQVAGANQKNPHSYKRYPPSSGGESDENNNNYNKPAAPQKIVAKIIPRQQQQRVQNHKPSTTTTNRQEDKDNNNDNSSPLSPPTPAAKNKNNNKNNNNNNKNNNSNNSQNVDEEIQQKREKVIREKEDHNKEAREAYERIQASQREARSSLRADFSKAAVNAVPFSSENEETSSSSAFEKERRRRQEERLTSSANKNNNNYNNNNGRGASGRPGAHLNSRESSTASSSSNQGHHKDKNQHGGCPHGCCSSSSCSCVHTSLTSDDPPAPLRHPHKNPLGTLHVKNLARGDGNDEDDDYQL